MSHQHTELFETIYHATFNTLSKHVYFKVAQSSDAEDIIQTIYIDYFNYVIKKNKKVENVQAYLIQMANHELTKYYKKKKEIPITFDDDNLILLENIQDEIDLESDILDTIETDRIVKLVNKLSIVDQKILGAHFRYDMTFKEIAQTLNLSENTIKTRYYRALKELRDLLTDD
jgi:RNA polymerase sigma-70 factor (ECF subfamily)